MRTLLVFKLPSAFPALFQPVLWPVPWPVRVRSGTVRVVCSEICLELVEDLLCGLFRGLLEPACRSLVHRISRLDIDVLSSCLPGRQSTTDCWRPLCRAGSFQLNSLHVRQRQPATISWKLCSLQAFSRQLVQTALSDTATGTTCDS